MATVPGAVMAMMTVLAMVTSKASVTATGIHID
jgi:hypothetical protein